MRDEYTEKDRQALANWEKWMKARKEVSERIGKAIGTEPPCLLMNRERKWEIDREKDVIYDAQLIKEYQCRSSNKELHKNNEINNYLERLVRETEARESAETALHRVASCHIDTMDHANKFTEKEIFMHINPLLYYHLDVIEKVKKLNARFFDEEWNYSMNDLCEKLVEKLKDEPQELKDKVFKYYSKLLRRLQKKPIIMDMLDSDWDMFKYHMTYMLLCTAIAEMEKCLNYKSWGLEPPNAPPGPNEEYKGSFVETRKNFDFDETNERRKESDTEEDEAKLAKIENEMIKEFGDDVLNRTKTINLNLGLGIRFVKDDDSREELEVDKMEEEGEAEEETEEEHLAEEEKNIYFLEEVEEEELYEEEMSEEEISMSTLLNEDGESGNNLKNEEETEKDISDEDAEEEDEEEEEEEDEEEEEEEEEEDEDELSIEEEEVIDDGQEREYLKSFTDKLKRLLSTDKDKSRGKLGIDSRKKKEPQSKQLGKEEQKQQKGVMPDLQKQEMKDQEPTTENEKKKVYTGGDPAPYLDPREEPPPWVRKHFLLFATIQWRRILEDAIDDVAALIESINFHKGATPQTNIKYSERAQYPC
ncbi:unnamed protein product [Nezara viridula]|uniref:Uncharacterized protein n=1 Tax=Nezara viridula TaxID=85310 RepID=A0A9P0HK56_NEZVI|nr:unnamed protein product [Nezara viridula]